MSCSRKRAAQVVAIVTVAVAAVLLAGVASAGASTGRRAVGTAARLPLGARFERRLPAARRLRLTIALKPRDPAALRAFATAVSTPGTPQYGRYLSVAQFARRFGAGSSELAAVSAAMRAGGLRVGAASANRLTIPVSGTVAEVQRAFAVTEARVRLPGGRLAFANDRAPRVAAQIAGSVQAVLGLDDIARALPQDAVRLVRGAVRGPAARVRGAVRRPAARVRAVGGGPAPCAGAANAAAGMGYTADEIASAYGIGSYYPFDEGAGQTVALVEFEAYDPNDIAAYQQCYGTSTAIANVNVDGGPGAFSGNDDESGLDIEQVIGLAPAANIRVYEAPAGDSQLVVLNAIASENVAKVVSSSWGVCEKFTGLAAIQAESTVLEEMAIQGQSFFNSSGDSGSTMCYQTPGPGGARDTSLSVIDPGSQPFATAVGGTYLGRADRTTPTDGSHAGEAVWNDGGADSHGHQAAGTGGGVSVAWTMPTYQSTAPAGLGVVQAASGQACGAQLCREVPDVSADGDPHSGYVVWVSDPTLGTGWMIAGGTSASAPLWAAFTALANASPACRGLALGFENPSLYALAGGAYAANFHDVAAPTPFTGTAPDAINPGTNDTWSETPDNANNPSDLYPVLPGYDMATGLGSPIANVLGNSLCALRAPVYTVRVAAPGNQLSLRGHPVSLAVHGSDSGNSPLSYSAAGLPAGLRINAATGAISGTPTAKQTATVTVRATDALANTATTTFTWTVVVPGAPQVTGAHRLIGLGRHRPRLTFSLAAGAFAPALAAVTIRLPGGLSFATTARSLAKGIVVRSGAQKVAFSLARRGGALTITLRAAASSMSVTAAVPALVIGDREAARVRAHRVRRLTLAIKVTDASRKTTRVRVIVTRLS